MTDDPVLDVEVAFAAQAEARLSQERTQRMLRRVVVLTAAVLVALSVATLLFVVSAVSRAADAAVAAERASKGNRELLAAFRDAQAAAAEAEQLRRAASDERLQTALGVVEQRRLDAERRQTAQLQLVLDLLVEEVRAPENREQPTHSHRRSSPRPVPRLAPRPSSSPSSRPSGSPQPQPSPQPSPSPSCATGQPVLGICIPPP